MSPDDPPGADGPATSSADGEAPPATDAEESPTGYGEDPPAPDGEDPPAPDGEDPPAPDGEEPPGADDEPPPAPGPDRRRAVAAALRERAEAALAAVTERFGDAPRREPLHFPTPDHEADAFPATVDEQLDRIAGIAGALVTDGNGRVLCVDVTYLEPDWQTPGGAVERSATAGHPAAGVGAADPLVETARTEVREETGIAVELTGLLYTRLVEYDYGYPEVAPLPMAVFTGRRAGGTLTTGGNTLPDGRDEIADVAWFAPDELPDGTLDYEWIVEYCEG